MTSCTRRSATAWDDVALRREVGRLQAEMDALWAMTKRNLAQAARHGVPGPGGSVVKVYYSELFQRITDLAMQVLGRAGLSREDAYTLCSLAVDFRVTQTVNQHRGVHGMVAKALLAPAGGRA